MSPGKIILVLGACIGGVVAVTRLRHDFAPGEGRIREVLVIRVASSAMLEARVE